MKSDPQKNYICLRELFAAAGEIAFEHSNSDQEAYKMVKLALVEILRKAGNPLDPEKEFDSLEPSSERLH